MPLRAVIRTARLTLRPLGPADEAPLVAALGDRQVSYWLTVVPFPYAPADFRDFAAQAEPGETWAIDDENGFAGVIGLEGELGYWLASHVWGRGYATEAARAILAAHFADPAAGPIRSGHFDGNDRSRGVLTKIGFRPSGYCIRRPASRPSDEVLLCQMTLTRADWLAANPLRIETGRLVLAPLDADRDWRDLARIGGDPAVAPMLMSVVSPWPEDEVRAWVARSLWRGFPGFRLGIFLKDGPLVGMVGLSPRPATVMYAIDPALWGRGYATEAMQVFLGWAVARFGLTGIEADHFADNPASGRVLEKLGFERIGSGTGTSRGRHEPAPNVLYRYRPGT
ncbi:MAG: GNAT family N-acetyltransferase [Paracoccaceae bacterium]